MTNTEKAKRINHEIIDCTAKLEKATKKYRDSIICLKMDIEENKELGNPKTANRAWVDHCNQDKAEINRLRAHIERLCNMLNEVA